MDDVNCNFRATPNSPRQPSPSGSLLVAFLVEGADATTTLIAAQSAPELLPCHGGRRGEQNAPRPSPLRSRHAQIFPAAFIAGCSLTSCISKFLSIKRATLARSSSGKTQSFASSCCHSITEAQFRYTLLGAQQVGVYEIEGKSYG
jgi:hypothetical protein